MLKYFKFPEKNILTWNCGFRRRGRCVVAARTSRDRSWGFVQAPAGQMPGPSSALKST